MSKHVYKMKIKTLNGTDEIFSTKELSLFFRAHSTFEPRAPSYMIPIFCECAP